MASFDKWFNRFLWGTDVVLLAASTPHIAAWYEHFDNPVAGDWFSIAYSWLVGYGLAIAIDGVSLMLLIALTRMIKHDQKGWGTKGAILFFMVLISGLSWFINWQYNLEFASNIFAKADATSLNLYFANVTVGTLNPIIGGAFSVLILAYALIGKAVKVEAKVTAITDEDHAQMLKRIHQEKEIKEAQKGRGLIASFGEGLSEAKQVIASLKQPEIVTGNGSESPVQSEEENAPTSQKKSERITAPLGQENEGESEEKEQGLLEGNDENSTRETSEIVAIDPTLLPLISRYPKVAEMLSTGGSTVDLPTAANVFDVTTTLLRNRVKMGKIRKTKNPEIVYKDSLLSWAKEEMFPRRKGKIIDIESARNSQEKAEENSVETANG